MLAGPIRLEHNLAPAAFVWLWAKYVTGSNPEKHCTRSILCKYSKRLSAHNELLGQSPRLTLDEGAVGTYSAIYVCGVAREGYRKHLNYPHNLHTAILPRPGASDSFKFERWSMSVENGIFLPIPPVAALASKYRPLPDEFTTCRIFRWSVVYRPRGNGLDLSFLTSHARCSANPGWSSGRYFDLK